MKKPLVIAVIAGIIAALCTALYLNMLENKYKVGAQKTKVLSAKEYIPQGTIIDENFVEEKIIPKEYIQPKALTSVKELITSDGKRVFMTIVPIEKGEQIVATKLSILGMSTGIASLIPAEKRAVTLVFDRELISGIIKPGNMVDIIGIFEYQDKSGETQESAFTILQNILILTSGKSVFNAPVELNQKNNSASTAVNYESSNIPVSFSVSSEEAEILILASEKGVIKFALRPIGDDTVNNIKGIKITDICKDIAVTSHSQGSNNSQRSKEGAEDMRKRQQEIIKLLKKYQK